MSVPPQPATASDGTTIPAWYASQRSVPLDPSLYAPAPDELAFYKGQTRITDEDELKAHVLKVQRDAYEVWPYPCIRRLAFTKLKISRFPVYEEVLKLGRERQGAILLDLGCCFGNDARKAVADGFPASQILASDLRSDFWALGHTLFKSTPETCPVRFVQGDIFSDAFFNPHLAHPHSMEAISACVDSASLSPLAKCASIIHASAFFHLFNEPAQLALARRLNVLLSNEPGSLIFGSHRGVRDGVPGERDGRESFAHSPTTWRAMWEDATRGDASVQVEAWLSDFETRPMSAEDVKSVSVDENGVPLHPGSWLVWVVRRA
ncbi:hypothetical protein EXIGLDRAFT_676304 [Exidia glandulosa HHB12029]|uniref:Methyltransferase domain-containing protein n=1 Tax=Exidia glandulosa HHB12029 TaxID=1314781 RepID=A0A165GZN4_EXIGL|nr:hypothetical protein EXIGLDRAFT_676304 [Exidia glandulosa HHB12029]